MKRILGLLLACFLVSSAVEASPTDEDARKANAIIRRVQGKFADLVRGQVELKKAPEEELHDLEVQLAPALRLDSSRWDGYLLMGTLMCYQVVEALHANRARINLELARGAGQQHLQKFIQAYAEYSRIKRHQASLNLTAMVRQLDLQENPKAREWQIYADGLIKWAGLEYEEAAGGARGAIADFKELLKKKFLVTQCRGRLAECYRDLGTIKHTNRQYKEAIAAWKTGLKYAETPGMRRLLNTNIASAFEADNDFAPAEEVIRKLLEKEPEEPVHWKNLGLVLGFQHRLREAEYCYEKTRELCKRTRPFIGYLHGNAWLRAAAIHGTLRREDGDVLKAWQLFLEYRRMLGDDYNFCLAFGEFCYQQKQLRLSWQFLERAKKLQPRCPVAYQRLKDIASRWPDPKERAERRKKALEEFDWARRNFDPNREPYVLRRVCGGDVDYGETRRPTGKPTWIEPDPLAAFSLEKPPEWVTKIAASRAPFKPFDPETEEPEVPPSAGTGDEAEAADPATDTPDSAPSSTGFPIWVVFAGLGAAVALLLWWRRR